MLPHLRGTRCLRQPHAQCDTPSRCSPATNRCQKDPVMTKSVDVPYNTSAGALRVQLTECLGADRCPTPDSCSTASACLNQHPHLAAAPKHETCPVWFCQHDGHCTRPDLCDVIHAQGPAIKLTAAEATFMAEAILEPREPSPEARQRAAEYLRSVHADVAGTPCRDLLTEDTLRKAPEGAKHPPMPTLDRAALWRTIDAAQRLIQAATMLLDNDLLRLTGGNADPVEGRELLWQLRDHNDTLQHRLKGVVPMPKGSI